MAQHRIGVREIWIAVDRTARSDQSLFGPSGNAKDEAKRVVGLGTSRGQVTGST